MDRLDPSFKEHSDWSKAERFNPHFVSVVRQLGDVAVDERSRDVLVIKRITFDASLLPADIVRDACSYFPSRDAMRSWDYGEKLTCDRDKIVIRMLERRLIQSAHHAGRVLAAARAIEIDDDESLCGTVTGASTSTSASASASMAKSSSTNAHVSSISMATSTKTIADCSDVSDPLVRESTTCKKSDKQEVDTDVDVDGGGGKKIVQEGDGDANASDGIHSSSPYFVETYSNGSRALCAVVTQSPGLLLLSDECVEALRKMDPKHGRYFNSGVKSRFDRHLVAAVRQVGCKNATDPTHGAALDIERIYVYDDCIPLDLVVRSCFIGTSFFGDVEVLRCD